MLAPASRAASRHSRFWGGWHSPRDTACYSKVRVASGRIRARREGMARRAENVRHPRGTTLQSSSNEHVISLSAEYTLTIIGLVGAQAGADIKNSH